MKIKFNQFERVAGLFVIISIVGFIISLISVAAKQGWFESKTEYFSIFENAEGVHPGTNVQISGLKAGSVEVVELTADNKVLVKFSVFSKFEEKIRQDSVVSLVRPFIIGERVVDISVGQTQSEKLASGTPIPTVDSLDLMTMLSGRKLGVYLASMSEMMSNLHYLAKSVLSKDRTDSMIGMIDQIQPLLKNMNTMSVEVVKLSKQVNKNDNIGTVIGELAVTTKQLNTLLPQLQEHAPHLVKDISALVSNLSELTGEFKAVIPAIAAISPELPRVSRRAVEALDEAVVLMKAMEKSFLIRGNAKEVREEEQSRERKPAAK